MVRRGGRIVEGVVTEITKLEGELPAGAQEIGKLWEDKVVTVSDSLQVSADAPHAFISDVAYTKYKEIKLNVRGKMRIKFDMKSNDGVTTVYARIYKNGVAIGTEQTTTSATTETKSEDIGGWLRNDLLQLYCHTDGSAIMTVLNFRLYWDDVGAEVVLD